MTVSTRFQPSTSTSASATTTRAILIAVQLPDTADDAATRSLDELAQLAAGLGMRVEQRIVQKRSTRTAPTYLGAGKLREVAALTGGQGEVPRGPEAARPGAPQSGNDDCVVIADDELGPGQLRQLEAALGVDVIDRTSLILRVFEIRAQTRQAKLEVELARLEYELPRVRDERSLGDREGGGGRAARGHTNVELAKQRARERMASLRRELEHVKASNEQQRRARAETFRVALVGYTNAGKSSLLRLLTGSDVLVENKLFATLGTTVRQLVPPTTPPILVVDTVGFIERLPHALVASFRATLEEANDAWLLLNVVDASDPAYREQIRVTEGVLDEIGAADTPTWTVLNKIDRLSPERRAALAKELPEAIPSCALDPNDGARLRERLTDFFSQQLVETELRLPYTKHGMLAALRDQLQIVHEEYGDEMILRVRGTPEVLGRLRKGADGP